MTSAHRGSPHQAPLEALGLSAKAVSHLSAYLDTLAAWAGRVNLTGARTPAERVSRLVASVLPAVEWLEGPTLLDIGSGNGSPGFVIALLREDLAVTLLEPRLRRWAFLREVCRRAETADVRVLRLRHDAYTGPPVRTVTFRALALPLSAVEPLVVPGGCVVVFGRRPTAGGLFEPEALVAPAARRDLHVFRRAPAPSVPRDT